MYLLLAILTFLENAFPPTPSDVAVALGAFLTHQSPLSPMGVFAVAWGASSLGAVVVYTLSRTYGHALFSGRVGRRLLSPGAVATIEREYLRFGIAGIFLGRLLPGVRSFVAPFAGLVRLHPLKALLPMIVASGLWYGTLTAIGALLGSEWSRINRIIAGLNTTLGWIAVILVAVVAVAWWLRRRRRNREVLWTSIQRAIGQPTVPEQPDQETTGLAAAAALALELARADEGLTPAELDMVTTYLGGRWALAAEPARRPGTTLLENAQLLEYANRVSLEHRKPEREALVRRLWLAAFADGTLSDQEARLMHRAGIVLGLTEEEVEQCREAARQAIAARPARGPAGPADP